MLPNSNFDITNKKIWGKKIRKNIKTEGAKYLTKILLFKEITNIKEKTKKSRKINKKMS